MNDSENKQDAADGSKAKRQKRDQNSAGKHAGSPTGFVVLVSFELKPGMMKEFGQLLLANARASLEQEQECLQFDIVVPDGAEDRVVLYEVYTTREAFAHHSTTSHYTAFSEKSADLVREKTVMVGARLSGPIAS